MGGEDQIRIGELLVGAGVISPAQLESRLEQAQTIGEFLGQVLLQSGDLTRYQLLAVIQVQSLLVDGILSPEEGNKVVELVCRQEQDLKEALKAFGFGDQVDGTCRLGQLLLEAGLINPKRLLKSLSRSMSSCMPLGATLVQLRMLPPDVVALALRLQRQVRSGALSRKQAVASLAELAGRLRADVSAGALKKTTVEDFVDRQDLDAKISRLLWSNIEQSKSGGEPQEARRQLLQEVGTVVAGRYEVLSLIGEGGMSYVYRVRHTGLGRVMALKMMQPDYCDRPEMVRRFEQEARAAAALSHPNVVNVHDFGLTEEGSLYLVMDFLAGSSLADLIDSSGPLALHDALPIFIQACNGLEEAHQKGILHRDLKPSNIMLVPWEDGRYQVKIVDFGIAKLLPGGSMDYYRITRSGELIGSPLYMSPEHCLGRDLDARSDIYSMGCVMYEALTGKLPFEGATVYEIFFKQLNQRPAGLASVISNPKACSSMETIIGACLSKNPSRRYESMSLLKAHLKELLDDEGESLS